MSATATALGARLEKLRRAGAGRFDPPGLRFAESLLERARALGGGAEARLVDRAALRIAGLEAAHARARKEVTAAFSALKEAAVSPDARLSELRARGELAEARRGAERALREARLSRRARSWLGQVAPRAEARASAWPERAARELTELTLAGAAEPGSRRSAQELDGALSLALFREAADTARAELAMARATDNLPEDAGPYNAQVLAARALGLLAELSPSYLCAFLARLDELGRLRAAGENLGPKRGGAGSRAKKPRTKRAPRAKGKPPADP